MQGPGFIQDKLELKMLILYISARVIHPIPYDMLWDLTLCDSAIDYFDFTECITDLIRTKHLFVDEDECYCITEKGLRNSKICESTLPYSVRMRCDKNVGTCNRKLSLEQQVQASHTPRDSDTFTVNLQLSDDMGSILNLSAMVLSEDMATAVEQRFLDNPQQLYGKILDILLTEATEEVNED